MIWMKKICKLYALFCYEDYFKKKKKQTSSSIAIFTSIELVLFSEVWLHGAWCDVSLFHTYGSWSFLTCGLVPFNSIGKILVIFPPKYCLFPIPFLSLSEDCNYIYVSLIHLTHFSLFYYLHCFFLSLLQQTFSNSVCKSSIVLSLLCPACC